MNNHERREMAAKKIRRLIREGVERDSAAARALREAGVGKRRKRGKARRHRR